MNRSEKFVVGSKQALLDVSTRPGGLVIIEARRRSERFRILRHMVCSGLNDACLEELGELAIIQVQVRSHPGAIAVDSESSVSKSNINTASVVLDRGGAGPCPGGDNARGSTWRSMSKHATTKKKEIE